MATRRANFGSRDVWSLLSGAASLALALVFTFAFFQWVAGDSKVQGHRLAVLATLSSFLLIMSACLARSPRLAHLAGLFVCYSALFAIKHLSWALRFANERWETLTETGRYDITARIFCAAVLVVLCISYGRRNRE